MNGYEPQELESGRGWWVLWDAGQVDSVNEPCDLPTELFEKLTGGELWLPQVRAYPTRQAALQALAVAMGRLEK